MSVLLCYSFSGFGLVSKVLVILHTFPSKQNSKYIYQVSFLKNVLFWLKMFCRVVDLIMVSIFIVMGPICGYSIWFSLFRSFTFLSKTFCDSFILMYFVHFLFGQILYMLNVFIT